jgi:hypothetical protein
MTAASSAGSLAVTVIEASFLAMPMTTSRFGLDAPARRTAARSWAVLLTAVTDPADRP